MKCKKCGHIMQRRKQIWHCFWCGYEENYVLEDDEAKFVDINEILEGR